MPRTDLLPAAERILKPIQQFSRGWMLDRATAEYGVSLGLRTGEEYWIVGRAGALGDVDHQIAAAALAFIAPVSRARGVGARPVRDDAQPGRRDVRRALHRLGHGRARPVRSGAHGASRPSRPADRGRCQPRARSAVRRVAIGRPTRRRRWPRHAHDAGVAGDARRRSHHRHPGLRPHPGRGDPGLAGAGAAVGRAVGRAPRLVAVRSATPRRCVPPGSRPSG